MLLWNEKFATGDSLIDTQHRMLISYINRLEELVRITNPSTGDMALFLRFIEFLEDYILLHFPREGACMYRSPCAADHENKRAHEEFLDFFREFKLRLETEGCPPWMIKELHESCTRWVKRHILRTDLQIKGDAKEVKIPDPPG